AIAPEAGGEAKLLTQALDPNVTPPHFSRDGKWIYFLGEDGGGAKLLRGPIGGGDITRPNGGRKKVESFSMSDDGTIAATIGELALPDEVHVLPVKGELRRLTATNAAVMSQIRLGDAEYAHFKSKD